MFNVGDKVIVTINVWEIISKMINNLSKDSSIFIIKSKWTSHTIPCYTVFCQGIGYFDIYEYDLLKAP